MADIAEENKELYEYVIKEQKKYTFVHKQTNPTIEGIYNKVKSGEINLHPEFQRNFIWDQKRKSLFIESLLLDLPIPFIFANKLENEKYEILDGQQRLSTIISFIRNEFVLKNLDILNELNGKNYQEIGKLLQKKLLGGTLNVYVIDNVNSSNNLKYIFFVRINQGSISLKPQEVRNVIFRGEMINGFKNIISEKAFTNIFDLESIFVARYEYLEAFLRTLMFYEKISFKKELNRYKIILKEYNGRISNNINSFLDVEKNINKNDLMINALENIYLILEKNSFKTKKENKNGEFKFSNKFNKTLIETQLLWTILFEEYTNKKINELQNDEINKINNTWNEVLENDSFFETIKTKTGNSETVKERYELVFNELIKPFINE